MFPANPPKSPLACCTLADIKPLRLLLLLVGASLMAVSLPQESLEVGLMTPVYRMAPGFYGR
ncbi:MAG TPA: hypothetical protein IGR64_01665 [Leptolyngbyaceae cyanobacterium M65_K2018_010]|nr:hypothetical protein [Leptolyngbyaceae cyanobacterium M65_K2018_010]